jgi:hypothetical protein
MRTITTTTANTLTIGSMLAIDEDTLWGPRQAIYPVTSAKCDLHDRIIEVECRDGATLRAIVRHSPEWAVRIAV